MQVHVQRQDTQVVNKYKICLKPAADKMYDGGQLSEALVTIKESMFK